MHVYKFRNCLLNTAERSVIRDRQSLELTPKTFDVLQYLIENVGKVVTKDEILGNVWNGSFVEESNLPVHISKLRRSLGETKDKRFIETIQGSGYRFVAPVQSVSNDAWQSSLRGLDRPKANGRSNKLTFDSIAVLPLGNDSGNPDFDYVVDGLTESITNSLSLIPELKVIARNTAFRYKNKDVDAKEVGESLGIATVLTGRLRMTKDDLVVGVELVDVAEGSQLWGKQFRGQINDIVRIKEELTSFVSAKLCPGGTERPASIADRGTDNAESYKLFLMGKYFFEKRTVNEIKRAMTCYEGALVHDPANLHAYAELAECYRLLHVTDAISYEYTVTQVRPLLAKLSLLERPTYATHLVNAKLKFLEWTYGDARMYCEQALALNPNCMDAQFLLANILIALGRFPEAIEQFNKILSLDPFSLLTYKRVGRGFYRLERYENAMEHLSVAIEMEPADWESLALLGAIYVEWGDYERALQHFRKSLNAQYSDEIFSMLGYVAAVRGRSDEARELMGELLSSAEGNEKHSLKLARIHLALKEKEKAYELIEIAVRNHEIDLVSMTADPRWKTIRSETRFQDLVRKVGLTLPLKLHAS
jgi:TolB-like protein/tetratricopeptide (TPR) repeat protein